MMRDQDIFYLRMRGRSLASIGRQLGASPERVRHSIIRMMRRFLMADDKWKKAEAQCRELAATVRELKAELLVGRLTIDQGSKLPLIEDIDDVEILALSTRAYNVLKNAGIRTVTELMKVSDTELLRFRNCGRVTVAEIRRLVAEFVERKRMGAGSNGGQGV